MKYTQHRSASESVKRVEQKATLFGVWTVTTVNELETEVEKLHAKIGIASLHGVNSMTIRRATTQKMERG